MLLLGWAWAHTGGMANTTLHDMTVSSIAGTDFVYTAAGAGYRLYVAPTPTDVTYLGWHPTWRAMIAATKRGQ